MKEKLHSLIFSVAGALAVLAAIMIAAFAIASGKNGATNDKLNLIYQRAMYDAKDNLNNIELNLSKMLAGGNQKINIELAGDVSRQSQSASDNLMLLPMDYHNVEGANKFLNQVGDFCVSYGKALTAGKDVKSYEAELETLYRASQKLNANFGELVSQIGDEANIVSRLNRRKLIGEQGLGEEKIINNSVDYPTLIYDGPFSDAKSKKSFKLLDDLPEISFAEAVEKLKGYFEDLEIRGIHKVGEVILPDAYVIGGYVENEPIFASISVRGGKLISFNRDTVVKGVVITDDKAEKNAIMYAEKAGFESMKPVWYNAHDGIAVVNLADECEGIIHYTDLVKVKVSLSDGSLIGIEATGYCTNHCARKNVALISENTAKSRVPEKFTLVNTRLALIPLDRDERLTYELTCRYDGWDYFIYVDAESADVVDIMRVVDDDQGKLVM